MVNMNYVENSLRKIAKDTVHLEIEQKKAIQYLSSIAAMVTKKSGRSLHGLIDDSLNEINRHNRNLKTNTKTVRETDEKVRHSYRRLDGELGNTSKLIYGLSSGFQKFGETLTPNKSGLAPLIKPLQSLPLIGSIAAVIGVGAVILDDAIENFRVLSSSGVQVGTGILDAMHLSARLGLDFADAAKLFSEYNGLTQKVGVRAMSTFFESVRNSSSELYALGIGYKDLLFYSAKYLEIQRSINSNSLGDITQREEAFKDTLKTFYRTTQMTGEDLGDLMDEYRKSVDDPKIRNILQRIPESSREAFIALQKVSPEMGKVIAQALSRGGNLAMTDEYGTLQRIGAAPQFQRIIEGFQKGTDITPSLELLARNKETFETYAKDLFMLNAEESANFVASLAAIGNRVNLSPEEINAPDSMTTMLLNAEPQINNLIQNVKADILESLTTAFGKSSPIITTLSNSLRNLPDNFGEDGFINGISSNNEIIADSIKKINVLFSNDSIFYIAMTAGIGAGFLALSNSTMLQNMIGKAFTFNKGAETVSDSIDLNDFSRGGKAKSNSIDLDRMSGKATGKAVGEEILEGVGKSVGKKAVAKAAIKTTARVALKALPLAGVAAGLYFGGEKLMQGDYPGAGLEVASGLVGMVPFIGTAASLGLSAISEGRDIYNATHPSLTDQSTNTLAGTNPDVVNMFNERYLDDIDANAMSEEDRSVSDMKEKKEQVRRLVEEHNGMIQIELRQIQERIITTNRITDLVNRTP